jgi:hypothetical protein
VTMVQDLRNSSTAAGGASAQPLPLVQVRDPAVQSYGMLLRQREAGQDIAAVAPRIRHRVPRQPQAAQARQSWSRHPNLLGTARPRPAHASSYTQEGQPKGHLDAQSPDNLTTSLITATKLNPKSRDRSADSSSIPSVLRRQFHCSASTRRFLCTCRRHHVSHKSTPSASFTSGAVLSFTPAHQALQHVIIHMSGTGMHSLGGANDRHTSRKPFNEPIRLWLRFSDVRDPHMSKLATDGRLLWLSSSVCAGDHAQRLFDDTTCMKTEVPGGKQRC